MYARLYHGGHIGDTAVQNNYPNERHSSKLTPDSRAPDPDGVPTHYLDLVQGPPFNNFGPLPAQTPRFEPLLQPILLFSPVLRLVEVPRALFQLS